MNSGSRIALDLHIEPLDGSRLPWRDRLTILRGQLTLLRRRCEDGIPITVEALAGAERIARSLELNEAAR